MTDEFEFENQINQMLQPEYVGEVVGRPEPYNDQELRQILYVKAERDKSFNASVEKVLREAITKSERYDIVFDLLVKHARAAGFVFIEQNRQWYFKNVRGESMPERFDNAHDAIDFILSEIEQRAKEQPPAE